MTGFNIVKLVKSFGYAVRGIRQLIAREQNARIHLAATVVVFVAGFLVDLNRYEWIGICAAVGLVWGAEGLNAAVEKLVDFISPEKHPQAGLVKDIAAGAVLICAIIAAAIGLLVFIPHLIGL